MTSNQLRLAQLKEEQRANLAREQENVRHNYQTENLARAQLAETNRANLVKEGEEKRYHDMSDLQKRDQMYISNGKWYLASDWLDKARSSLDRITSEMQAGLDSLPQAELDVFKPITDVVTGLTTEWNDIIGPNVSKFWDKAKTVVSTAFSDAGSWVSDAWQSIKSWVSEKWDVAKSKVSEVWTGIVSAIGNLFHPAPVAG